MRRVSGIAIVALLALAAVAPAASAAPLSMEFTEARANVGVQLSDDALLEAPDTAPFEAQINSNAITAGALDMPDFTTHITDPVNSDVTLAFTIGTITGSYNPIGGGLSLSGTAGGTLTASGHNCTVATVPSTLTLSTGGNSGGASPRHGQPFYAGLTGPGSIAGQWTDMTATPVTPGDAEVCEVVDEEIGGPGGIWMDQEGAGDPGTAFSMDFTASRSNVGVQLADAPLFEAPDTAAFAAKLGTGNAITSGSLAVPTFSTHITDPLNADVEVDFDIGPITGVFNPTTHTLVLAGTAGGTLTSAGKHCTVATVPAVLSLSTAGNSGGANPRSGVPFADGLDGDGAIAGQWDDMTATPVTPADATVCSTVDERIGGPGGIWLEQDVPDEVPPVCTGTSAETAFDTPVVLTLNCTGPERVISIATTPGKGTLGPIDQETGKVTYTPNPGSVGPDTFTFNAANGDGTSSSVPATIQVRPKASTGPGGGKPPVTRPGPKRKCPPKKKLKRGKCVKKVVKKKRKKSV